MKRFLLCLPLAVLVITGCSKKKVDDVPEPPRPVRIAPVTRADIDSQLIYGAELQPSVEVKLFSTVMDRILSLPFQEGDYIEKGEVVALIRREAMDRGLDQLGAQLLALDAQIANLESELARAKDLFTKGVATQQALDQVQTSYDATVAQRKALVAGRGQLAATAANAVVKAPISGVFANRMFEEGDIASPQAPLGRILVIDTLKVTLKLIESHVAKVHMGQEVTIDLDAYPGRTFSGHVTRILPYLDPETRTNAVEVSIKNPKDESGQYLLKPGMYGRAKLITERRENVIVAPGEALLLDTRITGEAGQELRKAVVVKPDNTADIRVVKLGARDGNQWEILEGLAEGESLVVRGHHGIKQGQNVVIDTQEDRL
ncbi:MAG: efflux RND transporter periplasmic adaptor subunit [Myxococcota bacterium]|jgi:RND family efflux transporter MFP subunit|nr:efflux RND transporter periplasmic adaptor subunit [Myxococcota bacterium]MBP8970041.1 efflux RND transporter periplasmic adaptor subunit [Myxococcota bacterium]HHW96211.1 efflux RND transporter periplasmic adaptor subunit [Oligoflexales bacterium]HQC43906.1 efflux RND transporter periplasmic adaptor subunit [Myxococcota bacterium]